jgi:BlaI family penicillinase repressor
MKQLNISEAEWEVMGVLWNSAPRPSAEIVDELSARKGWRPRTIRTLLDRLVQKGAVGVQSDQRPSLYQPKLSREECLRQESQSFMDRVFGGEPASMLLHLVRQMEISPSDVKKLKKILNEKSK